MEDIIEILDEVDDNDYDVQVRLPRPRNIHARVDHFEKWDET